MNGDKIAPDNNSTGKMDQSKVVLCLFLKANEQFAETVEKRVSDFNHPASGLEVRVTLYISHSLLGICSNLIIIYYFMGKLLNQPHN